MSVLYQHLGRRVRHKARTSYVSRRTVIAFFVLAFASKSALQAICNLDPTNAERVLLPAYHDSFKGANALKWWVSHFSVYNAGNKSVCIFPHSTGVGGELPAFANYIHPGQLLNPEFINYPKRVRSGACGPNSVVPATYFTVDKEGIDNLKMRLTLNVGGQCVREGTETVEIPVVRESSYRRDLINLIGIPLEATGTKYRYSLRIYDPDETGLGRVRVRAITEDGQEELGTIEVPLLKWRDPQYLAPAYAEISEFRSAFPGFRPNGFNRYIRLEISAMTADLRFWAMVSITDNETLHVTLSTPD